MEVNNLTTKTFNRFFNYKFNLISIVIMISIIHSHTSEEVYKAILVQDYNLIFVFTKESIYSYDSLTLSKIKNYQYETTSQQISSSSDVDTISLTSTNIIDNRDDLSLIYIVVKTYLYIYSNVGSCKKYSQINNLVSAPTNLIFLECMENINPPYCFFLIAYINSNKKLEIIKEKHIIPDDSLSQIKKVTYEVTNYLGQISQNINEYISCQIMNDSNSNILTCFYQVNNDEIGTVNFELNDLSKTKTPQFKTIKNISIIKSVLYSSNSKAFVCYIRNNGECSCLSFDIIQNEWDNCEYNFLENCNQETKLFSFDYYKNENEYILSCFTSSTTFSSISFDSTMEILDITDNNYCIYKEEITTCEEYPFTLVINYDNGFEIDISCSYSNMDDNLIQKDFTRTCTTTSTLNCINNYNDDSTSTINTDNSDVVITTLIEANVQSTVVSFFSDENEEEYTTDSTTDYYDNESSLISENNIDNSNSIIKKTINKSKEDLVNNLDDLMKDIELGKVYEMKADDYESKNKSY